MGGKFMRRGAVIDTIKSEERTNSIQKCNGTNFAVTTAVCGCPDPNCGAWHTIQVDRPLPSTENADAILKMRKQPKRKKPQARKE